MPKQEDVVLIPNAGFCGGVCSISALHHIYVKVCVAVDVLHEPHLRECCLTCFVFYL
jgi:hypothetical protein